MMKKAKIAARKTNKNLKLIGVTILTSIDAKALKKIGYNKPLEKIVKQQVSLAKSASLNGIVCSGFEVKKIKKICKKMEIITPGIRLVGEKKHDQKRVMTPRKAFEEGATANLGPERCEPTKEGFSHYPECESLMKDDNFCKENPDHKCC